MGVNLCLTLTLEEVCKVLGIKRTTFYKLRKTDPTFPKPIEALSRRDLHFSTADVCHWLETAQRG